jgi:hypothetical protein
MRCERISPSKFGSIPSLPFDAADPFGPADPTDAQ